MLEKEIQDKQATKSSTRSIVLLSGGMDSLVTAAIAMNESTEVYFLHVRYGQRTERGELRAFYFITNHYRPDDYLILDISYLHEITESSLLDEAILWDTDYPEDKILSTYVSFRNAHLLSIATSLAETKGMGNIYIGAVEEDSSGYPDCREVFIDAFNNVIKTGTKGLFPIEVKAPLLHMSKKEIVLKGMELDVPFQHSWSCYRHDEVACGKCASCKLRLKAFEEAGLTDPLEYQ